MTPTTLMRAIEQAEKFVELAKQIPIGNPEADIQYQWIETGKISGACRRASMELSRTLADLRRP